MKAIIFDMDGVLVDSEPVINKAAILGLKEYGVNAKPEDFTPFIGAGEARFIGGVAEKYDLEYKSEMKDRVYEIYFEILPDELMPQAGVHDCLDQLSMLHLKLALASSADRVKINQNLRIAGIPQNLFDIIISADDVNKKKPDPEIYQKAASMLNEEPAQCIVVEDALNGVQAAKAAGMTCIALASTFDRATLAQERPDYICDTLSQVCRVIHDMIDIP